MSGATPAEDVYATIEESARLTGAPCSHEKTWPILAAYGAALTGAGLVLSVSTGEHPPAELDYTLTVPATAGDPHAIALAHGLVTGTDHPVGTLLADVQERVTVSEHLVDCGTVSGFSKIYAHFPYTLLGVPELAAAPSAPPAVAANADLFARHHLHDIAMIGIDYKHRTVNLYFAQLPDAFREARNILSLNRAIGLPEPHEQMVEFAAKSFRVYVTLSWDSPTIERICFAHPPVRDWDPTTLPVRVEPDIEKFVRDSRRTYTGRPVVIAAAKWAPEGAYLNLGPYSRLSPLMRTLLQQLVGEQM
jgi:hypothetical protein